MSSVACTYCDADIKDVKRPGIARLVEGWIIPRNAGGANHIRYKKERWVYAHVSCVEVAHRGGSQDSLSFD